MTQLVEIERTYRTGRQQDLRRPAIWSIAHDIDTARPAAAPPALSPLFILGSLYLVGPIALRMWIPATRLDYTAFALVLIGIVGMVAHFWMQDYAGMAWSAGTVGAGIMAVGVHVVRRLGTAALPRAVSAHIVLAFLGVAYRLLPMVLPAAMPSGPRLWVSAVLLQAGVSGLFVTLLLRSPLARGRRPSGALRAAFSQQRFARSPSSSPPRRGGCGTAHVGTPRRGSSHT